MTSGERVEDLDEPVDTNDASEIPEDSIPYDDRIRPIMGIESIEKRPISNTGLTVVVNFDASNPSIESHDYEPTFPSGDEHPHLNPHFTEKQSSADCGFQGLAYIAGTFLLIFLSKYF